MMCSLNFTIYWEIFNRHVRKSVGNDIPQRLNVKLLLLWCPSRAGVARDDIVQSNERSFDKPYKEKYGININDHARCKLRMDDSIYPRQRSFILLHLCVPTHRSRSILRFIQITTSNYMVNWGNHPSSYDGYRLSRVCITLRANVTVGGYCNYKHAFSYSLDWSRLRGVHLGWILS